MLIPTSNESQLRTMCDNKKGESIPSVERDRPKAALLGSLRAFGAPAALTFNVGPL